MKLAILTITDGQNYGNRLQNYALQEVLRDLGHEVTTIRRRTFHDRTPAQRSVQGAKNLVKSMLGRDYEAPTAARRKAFEAFNRRYLTFSDPVLHDNLAPPELAGQYDRFIVGSDQVWNAKFRIISDDLQNHLAAFAAPRQRIAYAASFGGDEIPEEYLPLFRQELPRFRAVSVREESGAALAERCGAKAEVVLDPTMLLPAERWQQIARKPGFVKDEPFIATYFLGGRTPEELQCIERLAAGRKVWHLEKEFLPKSAVADMAAFAAAPDEFVWLLSHADCVLTDSYHAAVFSILFHRPFCVFLRAPKDKMPDMSTRMKTLLGQFGLENHLFRSDETNAVSEDYDADAVDRTLRQAREHSLRFLTGALAPDPHE